MAEIIEDEKKPYSRQLIEAPSSIVKDGKFVYGCYNTIPEHINMLDVERPYHYPMPRLIKDLRCKEWRAFQFGDKEWIFYTTLYEAKTFSLAIFNAYDKKRCKSFEIQKVLPFRHFNIGSKLNAQNIAYKSNHDLLAYSVDFESDTFSIIVDHKHKQSKRCFSGQFSFSSVSKQPTPSSVCLPLGLNRAMYSTRAFLAMQGWFYVDGERFDFSQSDSLGLVADNKGFYPYRMQYDWASGFGLDAKGRKIGFNLNDNQVKDQYTYNENMLWINSRMFPLPPIKITRPGGYEKPWHIQDTEGLVDLLFKPNRKNATHFNFLIGKMDYNGPSGNFEGVLRSADGTEKVDVEGIAGMAERTYIQA